MKLFEHYIQLYRIFAQQIQQGKAQRPPLHALPPLHIQTKIDEIQALLCCTKRHTKSLLKQLQEKQWIKWEAVRGRGKSSTLVFLIDPEEAQAEHAKELVLEGKYKLALEQLSHVDQAIKEQFHHWLSGQLGYMIEMEGNRALDVLRYPFYVSITSLDPAFILSRHDGHIVDQVFDPLVKYDHQQQKVIAHLAHHWEVEQGGKVWHFYLRKGIKFHHGRELTAQDVVHTFQRLRRLDQDVANNWDKLQLEKVEAPYPFMVTFTLKEVDTLFPHYLCYPQFSIIPLEVWEKDPAAFTTMPVGTGAFKVVKHDQTMLGLDAFDSYFKGRIFLDRVEILTLPELFPQENELINYSYNFGAQAENRIGAKNLQHWSRLERMEEGASYFTFNLGKKGPSQDPKFRQALCSALEIEHIATDLGFQNYMAAYSLIPAISAQKQPQQPDLEQSKTLLSQTDYNGEVMTICSTQLRPQANHEQEAYWLQQQWRRIGIETQVKVIQIYELTKPEILAQADIVVAGVAFGQSPAVSLVRTFQTPTAFITNMLDAPFKTKCLHTLAQVKREQNPQQQLQLLLQLESELLENNIMHFLHHRTHSVNVNTGSSLKGVGLNWSGRVDYKALWFNPS